jgi:hypothetical protein
MTADSSGDEVARLGVVVVGSSAFAVEGVDDLYEPRGRLVLVPAPAGLLVREETADDVHVVLLSSSR